jgi:hypothetical protein
MLCLRRIKRCVTLKGIIHLQPLKIQELSSLLSCQSLDELHGELSDLLEQHGIAMELYRYGVVVSYLYNDEDPDFQKFKELHI